jgi:hypothetical protein
MTSPDEMVRRCSKFGNSSLFRGNLIELGRDVRKNLIAEASACPQTPPMPYSLEGLR